MSSGAAEKEVSAVTASEIEAHDPEVWAAQFAMGDVARITGLSAHTIRWFEREGLLPHVARDAAGRRTFHAAEVYWLLMCTRLRETGMPIAGIKALASLILTGPGNEQDRLAILENHEREVMEKIAAWEGALGIIRSKIETYRSHLAAGTADSLWVRPE